MDCELLRKKLKEKQDQINALNAAEISHRYELKSGKTPEDIKDILVHQHGLTPELSTSLIESASGWTPDMLKQMGEMNKIGDNAVEFQKQAQSPGETTVNREFLKEKANTLRSKIEDAFSRAFHALPRGMNDSLKSALKSFATFKDMGEVKAGSGVYAGRNQRYIIDDQVTNLHKSSGSSLGLKEFRVGLETAAQAGRQENAANYLETKKQSLLSKVESKPVLKNLIRKIELAQEINGLPGVKEYLTETYRRLDVAKETAFPGEKGVTDYYHNHIIVEPDMDIWDSITTGDRRSRSKISERKVFKNGIEAEEAGFKPASDDFVETNGTYWSALGNKVRKNMFAERLRANAELNTAHYDKMMIQTHADASEAAFYVKPGDGSKWETPKTWDDKYYREMDNLGPQFSGIYVHPEVYRWQEKVFRKVDADGIGATMFKGLRFWKTIVLTGATPLHAGSLTRKYWDLSASYGIKDGLNNNINPKSGYAQGLSYLDVNSKFHANALKAMQNGLSLETHDMSRNAAFDRVYNEKTGNQTLPSLLREKIGNFTDWSHRSLFEKYRTGLKLKLAVELPMTDSFRERVKTQYEGDENAALSDLMTNINNHFGGQNLELIGRSRMVQSILQAMLLSPEWTEAKIKRAYGAIISPNDELRKRYQYSIMAEFGTMLLLRVGLQQLYSSYSGEQRTMDQMWQDVLNRRLASIYLGKTGHGIKEREVFVNIGQSENQDLALLLPLTKGIYDSFAMGDVSQVPKQIVKEMGHKLSPPAKAVVDVWGRHRPEKEETYGKKTYEAAKQFLPIGVHDTVRGLEGEYGPNKGMEAAKVLAGSLTGFPMIRARPHDKEGKKEEKKEGKTMRLIK